MNLQSEKKKGYYRRKYIETRNELQNYIKTNKKIYQLSKIYPQLFQHLSSLNIKIDDDSIDNDDKAKNGNRFDDRLVPIYILLSMAGEYFTDILHKYFGFPSTKTCRNLKKKYREKFGITDKILDGSFESITTLIDLFWKNDDRRCIIAVDAASVNAKLLIHQDGKVEGLVEDCTIDKNLIDSISNNLDEFHKFYQKHHEEIVKYFFVFYVCSLSKENKSFPILIKKKTNGSANNDIIADLEETVFNCRDAGLDVIGISFDGDPAYLNYVDNMCTEIENIHECDLNKPLSKVFTKYDGVNIYEDMMHLVKCLRYRLICGSKICPSLSKDEATFDVSDFRAIGVKEHVLDSNKSKKMDDNLPLQLFSQESISNAISQERFDLLLALLPAFLLINSVMSENLTREQRIEQLSFGFSLVATYYNEFLIYDFQNGLQRSSRAGGKNNYMTLYDIIWMKKYMSLTLSLTKVLNDNREIHLGALGTHFLEHFFGMVRRFCHGNDSASSFQTVVENIIVLKLIQKENILEENKQPGRSDSGAFLAKETGEIKEIPLNVCMWRAAELFLKVGNLMHSQLNKAVNKSIGSLVNYLELDTLQFIESTYANKKKSFRSTSKLRYNSTAGYTSIKRVISGNSI